MRDHIIFFFFLIILEIISFYRNINYPIGSAEVEVVKKSYTKLSDAYGCLGVLLVNSGKKGCLIFSSGNNSSYFR